LKDSTFVKQTLSDTDGVFTIAVQKGRYDLQIRQWGKLLKDTTLLLEHNVNIDDLFVDPTQMLSEVVVKGKKRVFEQKVDRLVFNVENDRFSKGLNGLEVLARTPRIEVSPDGALQMIGKGNVVVMINGRILNMPEDEIAARLRGLRAEDIAKIEVIPLPPAKYSAEGNSGFINIVLKKDLTLGLQGTVNGSVWNNGQTSSSGGVNLNYRSKKFEMMTGVNYNGINGINDDKATYDFANSTLQSDEHKVFNWKMYSFNSILQYKLTSKMDLGATIDYSIWNTTGTNTNNSSYFNKITGTMDSTINTLSSDHAPIHDFALSAYCDYAIDTLGKKVSFTYNHSSNINPSGSDLTSTIDNRSRQYEEGLSTYGRNLYLINSAMADVTLPYKWAAIETGLSFVGINNNSNVTLYDVNGGEKVIDASGTNTFKYNENTSAAYLSANRNINKRWTVKAGLRYEYTHVTGYSPTTNLRTSSSYGKLFPTVFVLYNPNDKNSISLSYARRIERPSFYDLNPFRYYSTVNSYASGNAYLLPQLSNNIEIDYSLNNKLNINLWDYQLNKAIDYVSQFNSQNVESTTAQNLYNMNKIGIYANYTLDLFDWWNLFCDGTLYYCESKSYRPELQAENQYGYGSSASIRSDFVLNKKKTLLGEISYSQNFPSVDGMAYIKSFDRLNASLRYSMLHDNLKFTLYTSDILNQNIMTLERQYTTYKWSQRTNAHVRDVVLSVTYSFGNKRVASVYRESKNKALERAGR
jgi:outer membrane receptor protein involved in Fe transport